MMKRTPFLLMLGLLLSVSTMVRAEDGSDLWLRFKGAGTADVTGVKGVAMDELKQNWQGNPVVLKKQKNVAKDGYVIATNGGKTTIAASTDAGLLYGAYHMLRLQQMGQGGAPVNVSEKPFYDLRILNHWDNPNGTVERGFAGKSIFLQFDPQKMKKYAQANASVGINGTVLNNVNAKPEALGV